MDRFFRGLTAGIAGGIVMNLWSAFAVNILKLKIIRFIDWASVILYGDLPKTAFQNYYSLIIQIFWAGFLGVVFTYLLRFATSRGYLIKGAFFGMIAGLIIYAIPVLFKVPYLTKHSTATVLSNHFGGLLWGLTMAQTLAWLDNRFPSENKKHKSMFIRYGDVPVPARKMIKKRSKK